MRPRTAAAPTSSGEAGRMMDMRLEQYRDDCHARLLVEIRSVEVSGRQVQLAA